MLRSAGSIRHAQSGMRNPNKTTNREEGSRCASRRSQSCFSSACPHPPRRRRTPAENSAIGSRAFGFLTFQTVQYAAQSPTAAWLLPDGMIGHGTMKPRSFARYSPMRCKTPHVTKMTKRPIRQREGSGYRTGLQDLAMLPWLGSRFPMNVSIMSTIQRGIRCCASQRSTVRTTVCSALCRSTLRPTTLRVGQRHSVEGTVNHVGATLRQPARLGCRAAPGANFVRSIAVVTNGGLASAAMLAMSAAIVRHRDSGLSDAPKQ